MQAKTLQPTSLNYPLRAQGQGNRSISGGLFSREILLLCDEQVIITFLVFHLQTSSGKLLARRLNSVEIVV